MGMKKYDTMEDYLADLPVESKHTILELRRLIQQAVPDVEEIFKSNYIRYSLVDGSKSNEQIMVTGYAKHVGFYPNASVIFLFEDELKMYKTGKGTIQFKHHDPLPQELIIKIVQKMKQLILEG